MKELHVGMRGKRKEKVEIKKCLPELRVVVWSNGCFHATGAPTSFSNPILWHRGQNLTANSEPRKSSRGVYQTFFNWFSDHGNPRQDDVAQVLVQFLFASRPD